MPPASAVSSPPRLPHIEQLHASRCATRPFLAVHRRTLSVGPTQLVAPLHSVPPLVASLDGVWVGSAPLPCTAVLRERCGLSRVPRSRSQPRVNDRHQYCRIRGSI